MKNLCTCWACADIQAPMYKQSDDDLLELIENKDDRHGFARVYAFIELYFCAGCSDPSMPCRVWSYVIGPEVPPRVSTIGLGAFKRPAD